MNRIGRAAVMLALGGITTRLLLNGGFGWFVQQRMRLPLWGAAIVLLAACILPYRRHGAEAVPAE